MPVDPRFLRTFAAVVRRYGGLVLGVARRQIADRDCADDVFQATFLALARAAGRLASDATIANWLYTAARQIASRASRSAKRRVKREVRTAQPSPSALDQMTGREAFAALDTELDRLPPIYREALVLRHLEGLTFPEIAARMERSQDSVEKLWMRGLVRLREIAPVLQPASGSGK